MTAHFLELIAIAEQQSAQFLDVSPAVLTAASVLDWAHRDPFGRIIGTTPLLHGLMLISADAI